MKLRIIASTLVLVVAAANATTDFAAATEEQPQLRGLQTSSCPTVETVANFNLTEYASKPWYVQQQARTFYTRDDRNYCVQAVYNIRDRANFWGYTVDVDNYAEDVNGESYGGPLCAFQTSESSSKLAVAPCFLPNFFAGPYWVVAYDEDEGYALVSGGQPTISGPNGCRTGTGVNNAGLWIFTQAQQRDDAVVAKVLTIALAAGFDIDILNVVDQVGCGTDDR